MDSAFGERDDTLIVERIEKRLTELEVVNVFGLSEAALRKWVQFSETVEPTLREAQVLLDEGRAFFTDQNMALFQYLRLVQQVLSEYRRRRWDNRTGTWRSPPRGATHSTYN